MKSRCVVVPFVGSVSVWVDGPDDANDEDVIGEAIEKAWEVMSIKVTGDAQIEGWELLRQVTTGNCINFSAGNDAEIIETEDR